MPRPILYVLQVLVALSLVPTGMLYNARVTLHAIFGGLLMLVLIVKAIISNFVRKQLRINVPLGVAAGVLTLGVFLLTVVPHAFRLY